MKREPNQKGGKSGLSYTQRLLSEMDRRPIRKSTLRHNEATINPLTRRPYNTHIYGDLREGYIREGIISPAGSKK